MLKSNLLLNILLQKCLSERDYTLKKWYFPLAVFLGGCSYGILSTFVKLAYERGFTTEEVVGSQFFVGCSLIWLFVLFMKKNKVSIKQFFKLAISGIPMGLTSIFYYQSLQTLHASVAIIFLFQFIWIGSLLEYLFEKRKPTVRNMISITVLIIGSVLASGFVHQSTHITVEGAIWGILSAITFSLFIYVSGKIELEIGAIQRSAIMALGGFFVVMLVFPPFYFTDINTILSTIPFGLILGLFGVALPPLLFAFGMPRVGAGLGTILSASELPVAVMMSYFVLKEAVNFLQWAGVVCILLGIIYGNIDKKVMEFVKNTKV